MLGIYTSLNISFKSFLDNDVTAGYIIADVERLRQPMQKITEYILKCIGVLPSAAVIPIQTTIKGKLTVISVNNKIKN